MPIVICSNNCGRRTDNEYGTCRPCVKLLCRPLDGIIQIECSENLCDFCNGVGNHFSDKPCTYCNGTGEWNQAAQSYVENHICQCIFLDREHCPICHKKCHHDASLSPKQVIDSGYGGLGAVKGSVVSHEEEEIIA